MLDKSFIFEPGSLYELQLSWRFFLERFPSEQAPDGGFGAFKPFIFPEKEKTHLLLLVEIYSNDKFKSTVFKFLYNNTYIFALADEIYSILKPEYLKKIA